MPKTGEKKYTCTYYFSTLNATVALSARTDMLRQTYRPMLRRIFDIPARLVYDVRYVFFQRSQHETRTMLLELQVAAVGAWVA